MGLPDNDSKALGALLFWLEEAERCPSWPQLLLELGQGGGDRLVELIRVVNREPRAWPADPSAEVGPEGAST